MKRLCFLLPLLFLLALPPPEPLEADDRGQPRHILPIDHLEAIDGDSFKVVVSPWPGQRNQAILRLTGWDAPESTWRAQCDEEGRQGQQAKALADSLVRAAHVRELSGPRWDKYGGRVLGTLLLDGEDIGPKLEARGLVRPYKGQGAKPDWCGTDGHTARPPPGAQAVC